MSKTLMVDGKPVPAESGSTKSEGSGSNVPDRVFKSGSVHLVVWKNTASDGGSFHTFSLKRNYRDDDGDWKSTGTLRGRDLVNVIPLVRRAVQVYCIDERLPGNGGGNR